MTDDALLETDISDDLADLDHVADWSTGAALWSTDWTAETVLSQLNRGNIDLNPSFQRRSAWTETKQSLFIESLILGLPVPQLILAEDRNRKGAYIVIDGKQRLLTIRKFSSTDGNSEYKPLKLNGLSERDDLNRKSIADLENEVEHQDDLAAFQNATIRTIVIRNWKSEAYLWEVFLRINTGSVQLSPQELRQALHPGDFSNFVDNASSESQGLQTALNITEPDFRMRDAEILLRYLAYKNFAKDYAGNLKHFLDSTTKYFNTNWDSSHLSIESQVAQMEEAFNFTEHVFGRDSYLRKWNGSFFEPRKNRAIFDIMLHYFSESYIRDSLKGKEKEIVQAFKNLCSENPGFLASIERTTKTPLANHFRFNLWASELSKISSTPVPEIDFGVSGANY